MSAIIAIALDLAKNVFQLHQAEASGRAVLRRKLRRGQVLEVLAGLPRCMVAMEACATAQLSRWITGAFVPLCASNIASA